MSSVRRSRAPGARGKPLIGGSGLPVRLRGVSQRRGAESEAAGGVSVLRATPSRAEPRPLPRSSRAGGGDTRPLLPDRGVGAWGAALCSLSVYLPLLPLASFRQSPQLPEPLLLAPSLRFLVASGCRLTSAQRLGASSQLAGLKRPTEGGGRLGKALLSPSPRCFRLGSLFAGQEGSHCLVGRKVYVISLHRSFAGEGGLCEVISPLKGFPPCT